MSFSRFLSLSDPQCSLNSGSSGKPNRSLIFLIFNDIRVLYLSYNPLPFLTFIYRLSFLVGFVWMSEGKSGIMTWSKVSWFYHIRSVKVEYELNVSTLGKISLQEKKIIVTIKKIYFIENQTNKTWPISKTTEHTGRNTTITTVSQTESTSNTYKTLHHEKTTLATCLVHPDDWRPRPFRPTLG